MLSLFNGHDVVIHRLPAGQGADLRLRAHCLEQGRSPGGVLVRHALTGVPNNKNIIMAAQQCVGLSEKEVVVVPTATVPQGISAMMNVDPEEPDAQVILQAMTDAAANVTTAQITYAARNSDFDGFAINEGDYLALCDGKLMGTDRNLDVLLERLARNL